MVDHPFVEDSITTPIRRRENGLFHSLRGALPIPSPLRRSTRLNPTFSEPHTKRMPVSKAGPKAHVIAALAVAPIVLWGVARKSRWPIDTASTIAVHALGPGDRGAITVALGDGQAGALGSYSLVRAAAPLVLGTLAPVDSIRVRGESVREAS